MGLVLRSAAHWLVLAARNVIPQTQDFGQRSLHHCAAEAAEEIAVQIKATASRLWLAFGVNCPEAALFRGLFGALVLQPP